MGAGFYILWNKVNPVDPQTKQTHETAAKEEKQEEEGIRPAYSLETFIVNLADQGNTSRYLRATMDLELTSEKAIPEIKLRLPQIRDAILTILPAKTSQDITTIGGKNAVRDEIMTKLNSFLKEGSVTNIFFTEFVIQ
jgi:flagellar protein FliL